MVLARQSCTKSVHLRFTRAIGPADSRDSFLGPSAVRAFYRCLTHQSRRLPGLISGCRSRARAESRNLMPQTEFSVNGRQYTFSDAPVVVICIDGSEPAYHEQAIA